MYFYKTDIFDESSNETPMYVFSTFAVLWQRSKPYCDAHTSETAEISGDKPVWWT